MLGKPHILSLFPNSFNNSTLKDLMKTVFDSQVVSEFLSLRTPTGFGELWRRAICFHRAGEHWQLF